MRWDLFRRSDNVVDLRPNDSMQEDEPDLPHGDDLGVGVWGIVALLAWTLGFDLSDWTGGANPAEPAIQSNAQTRDQHEFVARVLGDIENRWQEIFERQKMGRRYSAPELVLYSEAVHTGCGLKQASVGPFYCPRDAQIYLDPSFFSVTCRGNCAFPHAYFLAHEVGHHVQNLLGIIRQVERGKKRLSLARASEQQVALELQADCFAGVWAHYARRFLEQGDIEAGAQAAFAIGDDRVGVARSSYTHGAGAERAHWFSIGYEYGLIARCNSLK